jgi:hypothetical protein
MDYTANVVICSAEEDAMIEATTQGDSTEFPVCWDSKSQAHSTLLVPQVIHVVIFTHST